MWRTRRVAWTLSRHGVAFQNSERGRRLVKGARRTMAHLRRWPVHTRPQTTFTSLHPVPRRVKEAAERMRDRSKVAATPRRIPTGIRLEVRAAHFLGPHAPGEVDRELLFTALTGRAVSSGLQHGATTRPHCISPANRRLRPGDPFIVDPSPVILDAVRHAAAPTEMKTDVSESSRTALQIPGLRPG